MIGFLAFWGETDLVELQQAAFVQTALPDFMKRTKVLLKVENSSYMFTYPGYNAYFFLSM